MTYNVFGGTLNLIQLHLQLMNDQHNDAVLRWICQVAERTEGWWPGQNWRRCRASGRAAERAWCLGSWTGKGIQFSLCVIYYKCVSQTIEAILHCVQKKRDQNVFLAISSIKLWRFWQNLVNSFLNNFARKSCKRFSRHLNNVSTLPCGTFKCSSHTCCHRVVTERNSRIYPASTVASKFARFESSW